MDFINVVPAVPNRHKVIQQCQIIGDFGDYIRYLIELEYLTEPGKIGKEKLMFEFPQNGGVSKFELYLDDTHGWVLRYNVIAVVSVKGEKVSTIITKTIFPKPDL